MRFFVCFQLGFMFYPGKKKNNRETSLLMVEWGVGVGGGAVEGRVD